MEFNHKVLRSKVARRILLLFISGILLPITVVAVLSLFHVSSQLREQSIKQLMHASKTTGMMTFHNLEIADADLQLLVAQEVLGKPAITELLAQHFRIVTVFDGPKARSVIGPAMARPDLSKEETKHLTERKSLLKLQPCFSSPQRDCLLMLRGSSTSLIAGQLDPNFIFEARAIPLGSQLAVLSASRTSLFNSRLDGQSDALLSHPFDRSSGSFEWHGGDDTFDAAYWKLLVRPTFVMEPWTIVISQNREEALAPMARFRQSFPLMVLLAFWIVLLLSLVQVRRTLGPLQDLQAATLQIARRDFKLRLEIRSGDEFESLAHGFNTMAAKLDEQFKAMEDLHWGTLTALARAIDAKSQWTAGHSERVTVLAIDIGREMGLSPGDLDIMHMGGLLHDIGKIGITPDVLDKPGKLTPQQVEIMMSHVEIGVRIIEPVTGFAAALPIVAQHHEWYDGTGYPAGLLGDQIAPHARIFAVADCFDALTSDRPYREGMPIEKTLEMMRGQSGTHFDPKVMDAFLRMMDLSHPQPAQLARAQAED